MKPYHYLKRLEIIKFQFDSQSTGNKFELLKTLKATKFNNPQHVKRFHEILNFLYAYPDNQKIFRLSSRLLDTFHKRVDLQNLKPLLNNSGIAGTDIEYQFYWPMARWLADNYPKALSILWEEMDDPDKFMTILPLLLSRPESGALEELHHLSPGECVDFLKHKNETDAVFIIHSLLNSFGNDHEREAIHDDINLSYRLIADNVTPSIANTRLPVKNIAYQLRPFDRRRPVLATALKQEQFKINNISRSRGNDYIDLARKTMLTHERDLNAFSYGNPADVRCISFADGHQIIANSMVTQRRYLLHSTYGFLNIRNGMPIGYFQIINLYNTAEIAFNLFSPFRGGETAKLFARNLAAAHQAFEVDTFILDPYQLGHGNEEGLLSGVWWFYYKLGFRPIERNIIKLANSELKKMNSRPGYRTSVSTLNELASENLYYNIHGDLDNCTLTDKIDYIPLGISKYLSRDSSINKRDRIAASVLAARQLTAIKQPQKLTSQLKHMWECWAPLVLNIKGIKSWSLAERKKVGQIISLRGAPDEQRYVSLLNRHTRLRQGIIRFADKLADQV